MIGKYWKLQETKEHYNKKWKILTRTKNIALRMSQKCMRKIKSKKNWLKRKYFEKVDVANGNEEKKDAKYLAKERKASKLKSTSGREIWKVRKVHENWFLKN